MASKEDVPSFGQLIGPTLSTLHRLGGSASIQERVDELTAPKDHLRTVLTEGGWLE